ncbi:hypothetical protein V1478_010419 [Vespula squamosa]|uniref:Uncharacterized protein n=1 Tax=Vespula squamosa TaxID=30214 RepID=A0ABD2AHQ6_VESSQ
MTRYSTVEKAETVIFESTRKNKRRGRRLFKIPIPGTLVVPDQGRGFSVSQYVEKPGSEALYHLNSDTS